MSDKKNQTQQQEYLQDERNQHLHQILQLNARLAGAKNESELLDAAVSGICGILDLVDVTIFQLADPQWLIRTTTSPDLQPGIEFPAEIREVLNRLTSESPDNLLSQSLDENADVSGRVACLLHSDQTIIGAVVGHTAPKHDLNYVPLLFRAFSLNLSVLWQNLSLLLETQRRAVELEILHNQAVGTIWQSDSTSLQASYEDNALYLERDPQEQPPEANGRPSTLEKTIPLLIGDRPIGDLSLPTDISLDDEEEDFINALLREMGNALNNAQLLQTTRSYSAQLQVAADVSRAASTILERDILVRRVVDLVRDGFDLYYVGLFLIDESDEAVLLAGTGEAGKIQVEQGHKIQVGSHSMIGQAIARDEAIVEQDVTQAADWRPNPHLPDTRSELAVPLRTRGRTIGALTIQSSQMGAFIQENITVLQTVADQMATAIENASLFAQIQENLAETNRLYRAGRKISEATNAFAVYQELIDFAAESGIVDLAHIITPDPTSPEYLTTPILWSRHETHFDAQDRFLRDKFPFSDRIAGKEIVIIRDALNDETLDPASRLLFTRNNVRSAAIIPIHSEDRWLATLALDRREPFPPSHQELQPFLTLCDQAAVILANQQLLDETESLYRVSRALNQASSQEDIFEITIREIVQYTGVDQCHIVLYDDRAGYGQIAAMFKENVESDQLRFPMAGDETYQYLSQQRLPLLLDQNNPETSDPIKDHYLRPLGLHTTLLVPAISQTGLIGFIALDSYGHSEYFHRSNINFAQTIADQFTTALESIKRFDEALARARELNTLNLIGARVAGTLDLDELALVLYEQVGKLLDNTIFHLALYNPESDLFRPLLMVENGRFLEGESRTLTQNELLYTLLHEGQPIIADHSHPLAQTEAELLGRPEDRRPESILWIPLVQESIPTGLISIQSYQPRAYDENELQVLRSIANQAVLAISNAQLFSETQERVAEWRLLFSITQAAASSIDSKERIENVVEALYNNLRGADVALMIANESRQQLETVAAKGLQQHHSTISYSEGLPGQVVQLGQPLMINDLRELPDFQTGHEYSLAQLVVPLNLGGRTIGIIDVQSRQVDAFTEQDLRLLQTLSVSLAATIQTGRLIEEIQQANERLRELDQLKTQFLANMSHELRTPLNSIIGFSRVILKGIDGPITSEQEEDLNSIHNSGQHLLSLINDILDVARIEAGKMTLAYEFVDIEEMANSVNSTVRGLVKDKDVVLDWYVEKNLPMVEADPIRLRQILLNFLSNAAKFTEKGRISLYIVREGPAHVHIAVSDTGIGIAKEDYGKLFEAFEQVDSSATRSFGGTGLGLPITKKLVEMHLGKVWVESEVGQGSTFHVLLPVRQNEDSEAWPELSEIPELEFNGAIASQTKVLQQPAILVVDDEPGVGDLYERYLRSKPFQIFRANSGVEALRTIREDEGLIRLILLDINMPGLNGWDVLKEMKDNPDIKDIPVIVCSIEDDPVKAAALGARHSLLKPIVEDDLLHALHEVGIYE